MRWLPDARPASMIMIEIDSPLFASLPANVLARLHDAGETRHFAIGEAMLSEGEQRGELFVVLRGEGVVVGRDWHGERQTLARLGPGQCFGELSMLSGEPASATVEAGSETDVFVLPHAVVVDIAGDHPELGKNLTALLGERLRISNERHLHAQNGHLVALVAPGEPPWARRLAYRLASSVAKHTRYPTTVLDYTARGADRPASDVPMRSLEEAVAEADAVDGRAPEPGLQFVSCTGPDEMPGERELDALLDHSRNVVALLPPAPQPHGEALMRRAGKVLVLLHEAALGEARIDADALPARETPAVVVLSDQQQTPIGSDTRRAQKALDSGLRVRSVIPGGAAGLDEEPYEATRSSRTVDRLARKATGLSIGLALGAGGAKGYAHIGVVRALQRADVPFDCVTGCSIGAPLAAGVAAGWDLELMRTSLDEISRKAVRPNVPVISILSSRGLRSELRRLTEDRHFDEAAVPLGIVAVDIETGDEVVMRSGPAWLAMVASMAYPGIYEPVRIGARQLVDGGVLNPVPVTAAVSLGADLVIGSNLSSVRKQAAPGDNTPRRPRLIVESIARSFEIMQSKIVAESCNRADVAIECEFDDPPGLLDFKRGRQFEHVGEQAAERALPKLRSMLPWLA